MTEKYSIFHINGGLGKHIAATAVAKCIKNNYPDRKLIVIGAYSDVFLNLNYVDRVYQLGNTSYFYQTYIENQDSLIFGNEPYFTTDHIHKRLPLIQTWCKMYGLKYNNETPDLKFNALQKNTSKQVWTQSKKPTMVLHTNGGIMMTQAKPYMWARDMPHEIAQKIVKKYHKDYTIYHCTKCNSPRIENTITIESTLEKTLTTLEFLSVILYSDKRILIDSCLQHAAAALDLPSTVLWNGTSPKVFGYDMHTNIETVKPQNFKLPGSVFFDFDFMGMEHEYPYDEDEELFNIDKIFEAIENQNK